MPGALSEGRCPGAGPGKQQCSPVDWQETQQVSTALHLSCIQTPLLIQDDFSSSLPSLLHQWMNPCLQPSPRLGQMLPENSILPR